MYLSEITLKNFRIFQSCTVNFSSGLNLIVGENDAGKSALIDAVKLVLGTLSNDWMKIDEHDFHNDAESFQIICILKDLTQNEAAYFLEWLSFDDENNYYLKIAMHAKKMSNGKPYYSIYAGADEDSGVLQGEAREKLRVTYLKPLRDAEFELTPKKNSRFSQILDSFHTFQDKDAHPLVDIMKKANEDVKTYFSTGNDGSIVQEMINIDYLANFSLSHNPLSSRIDISGNRLKNILEKLELRILNRNLNENLGLGSNNLLFIAAEMLLLKKDNDYTGLKLALIEEIEAHLHPQSQLNLVDYLEKESAKLGFQSIVTTHSNSLASKISIDKLILCKGGNAFSMHEDYTKLRKGDYGFLKRFLDATKANLFFANGVLMVEGDAENLLLPSIAELIGKPLYKYGVSIVNVGSTALLRYSTIFQRKDNVLMGIPVACVADRDIPPKEAAEYTYILEKGKNTGQSRSLTDQRTEDDYEIYDLAHKENKLRDKYTGGDVKVFYTNTWTLEFEIAKSCLKNYIHKAITHAIHSNDLERELNQQELDALYLQCDQDIQNWESAGDSLDKIAVAIYAPLVRGKASKAVTAQLLSQLLEKNKTAINSVDVRADIHLKYLIEAIDYVTMNSSNG